MIVAIEEINISVSQKKRGQLYLPKMQGVKLTLKQICLRDYIDDTLAVDNRLDMSIFFGSEKCPNYLNGALYFIHHLVNLEMASFEDYSTIYSISASQFSAQSLISLEAEMRPSDHFQEGVRNKKASQKSRSEAQNQFFMKRLSNIESDKLQLQAQIQRKDQLLNEMKARMEDKERENTTLQTENTTLQTENLSLQIQIKDRERKIIRLQTENTTLQTENTNLQTENTALQTEIKGNERENIKLKIQMKHQDTVIESLNIAKRDTQQERKKVTEQLQNKKKYEAQRLQKTHLYTEKLQKEILQLIDQKDLLKQQSEKVQEKKPASKNKSTNLKKVEKRR